MDTRLQEVHLIIQTIATSVGGGGLGGLLRGSEARLECYIALNLALWRVPTMNYFISLTQPQYSVFQNIYIKLLNQKGNIITVKKWS